MHNTDFTFYTNSEYWQALEKQFAQAGKGDRLAMIVMCFDPREAATATVVRELLAAADRGAEVHLVIDAYNFLLNPDTDLPGPLWGHLHLKTKLSQPYQAMLDAIHELDSKPTGHATIINKPARRFTNPKGGRSHIKYTIINNRVFVGGCNMHHTLWRDVMLSWRDQRTADYLFDFMQGLHRAKSTQALMQGLDQQLALDARTTLLIDAGKKHQSLIFEKALEVIDAAEESLLITCQYFPNSVTGQHLVAAHRRGVDVQIIYAHPAKQGVIGGAGQRVSIARERLRVPPELFRQRLPKSGPGVHAKIIASEKSAIIGSHNYVTAGVLFGTAEIALLRHDANFARQTVAFVQRLLADTKLTIR